MNVMNKAKLTPTEGAVLPESSPIKLTENLEDIVIAYDQHGEPVSRASDLIWKMTAYHSHQQQTNLHFVYWEDPRRKRSLDEINPVRLQKIRELQYLLCTILFSSHGADIGVKKLQQYHYTLKKLAIYAEQNEKSLLEVLGDSEALEAFLKLQTECIFCGFLRILRFLYRRKLGEIHFEVAPLKDWDSFLRKELVYYQSSKQHAPLPTRIYSELIRNIDDEINFIDTHLPTAILELETLLELWKNGLYKAKDRLMNYPALSNLIERYEKQKNLKGISAVFKCIHIICKLQIQLFTGMRSKEVMFLPFYCTKTAGSNGRYYALLTGDTTKLNKGKRLRAQWVTTAETGHRAVKVLQSVSRFIYKSMNVVPSKNDDEMDTFRLFLSTDYLPWEGRYKLDRTGSVPFSVLNGTAISDHGNELLANKLIPTIDKNDLTELEDIDPFRLWDEEPDFQIGKRWLLKSHQLRRSIALYARSSGIVQISSLRRQLQHISNDMTSYYSNGSAFAKSFIEKSHEGFKTHFISEWQSAAHEVEVLSFIRDVLRSNEPLHGGAGNFYFNQNKNGLPLKREEIEKAVKAGTLAYKVSPIGGCTKPGQCESNTGLSLFNHLCVTKGCKHLVGKHSKLQQVILAKESMLNHMDQDSVEFKVELEELTALKQVEVVWRSKSLCRDSTEGDL